MTLQDTLNKMKEMGFEQDAIDYAELQLKQNNVEFASKLMELMMTLKIGQDIFDGCYTKDEAQQNMNSESSK